MATGNRIFILFLLNNYILKYFIVSLLAFQCSVTSAQNPCGRASDSIATSKTIDKKTQLLFQSHRTKSIDLISKYVISPWGNGIYSLPLLAGIYISGKQNDDDHNCQAALHGFEALIFTAATTSVFKLSFHRHRPCETDPPNSGIWDGPSFKRKNASFPSGHTSSAFCIAALLASEYKDKPAIGTISISLASLVGISRIYENKHWLTDVLAGAALGFACGKLIYALNK